MRKLALLFWPAFGFYDSLRSLVVFNRLRSAGFIFFYSLYGFGLVYNQSHDTARYALSLKEKSFQSFGAFFELISQVLKGEKRPDLIQEFIEFCLSRFSTNEFLYFSLLGAILGLAFTWLLKELLKVGSHHRTAWLLLVLLITLLFPGRILSFQHYLATIIFSIGFLQINQNKWKVGLLLWASTALIHFGFLLVLPFVLLYWLFRKSLWGYYAFIVLAYMLANEVAPYLRDTFMNELNGELQSSLDGYTSKKYIDHKVNNLQANTLIIITYFPVALRYILFTLSLLVFHFTKDLIARKQDVNYRILLLFFGFLTLFSGVPTVVERFSITYGVVVSVYLFFSLKRKSSVTTYTPLLWAITIWAIILNGRLFMEFFSAYLLMPLGYGAIIIEGRFTIMEALSI